MKLGSESGINRVGSCIGQIDYYIKRPSYHLGPDLFEFSTGKKMRGHGKVPYFREKNWFGEKYDEITGNYVLQGTTEHLDGGEAGEGEAGGGHALPGNPALSSMFMVIPDPIFSMRIQGQKDSGSPIRIRNCF